MSALSSRPSRIPRLGINVDHIATLRQARGLHYPDPVAAAVIAESAGADQISIHLRADRRHIQDRDVAVMRQTVQSRLNLEIAPTEEMIAIAVRIGPTMVTLLPEENREQTTEGGLDIIGEREALVAAVERLRQVGVFVSAFVDPDLAQIREAKQVGIQGVQVHCGAYGEAPTVAEADHELGRVEGALREAVSQEIGAYAGHGLHYKNVQALCATGLVEELNIGHAIIARAVIVGMERAVREMIDAIRESCP